MNIQKLMKQAQAMQAGMAQAQEQLATRYFTAEAAGGKIKATANGTGDLTDLTIDPSVIDPEDAEFLQSLVLKAAQDAIAGAKAMAEKEMKKLTGGMGMPF
ncbi:MAG: YbaB/EbfC family nucleoid-associated protein [Akkermansia sp.]